MNLLNIVLAVPLIGFLVGMILPKDKPGLVRGFALLIALITFALSLGLLAPINSGQQGFWFQTDEPWITKPSIHYHVGLDGVSIWLLLLSTFLTPLAMLLSWKSVQHRIKEFNAFLLLLEFGLIGVFASLDLFLFYVFWEVCLVPMYFLIGIWGHDRRIYAAVKFFLYTMVGSVLMLAAIIYLYSRAGTFDYVVIYNMLMSGKLHFDAAEQLPLVPGVLPRVCDQGAAVPAAHLVA